MLDGCGSRLERFSPGCFALKQGDSAKAFLLAKGVECEMLDSAPLNVKEMMQSFVDGSGQILACGTCLKLRHSQGSELCPPVHDEGPV